MIRFLEEHGSARFEPAWEDESSPSAVTPVTTVPNSRLPENAYGNQQGNHINHGNRENDICAEQLSRARTSADIHLSHQTEYGAAAPLGMRTMNRAGFRRRTADGLWQYMAFPEAWKIEIAKGFDPSGLARAMVDRGLIDPDPSRNTPARQVSVRGYGKPRLYVFAAGILGDGAIS